MKLRTLIKLCAAALLLALAFWLSIQYANWMLFSKTPPGLADLLSSRPTIAVAMQVEGDNGDEVVDVFRQEVRRKTKTEMQWAPRSSEANVILIAVRDWAHMTRFSAIPGLEAVVQRSTGLPASQHRIILIGEGSDGKIATVIYMIPDLSERSMPCLSTDFAAVMVEIPDSDGAALMECLSDF